ncbi:hypothetical protein DdX_19144 [Ditylenchus destructor]|uniref:Uncharacterized protein n=1 Tax=Ditylenchus destructor TaxID=166010 RepID=A0AAD4MKZ5_9BILA|nr:hypothetical protein DdX_19144 [Ditylenchus destructor]
MIKNVWPEFQPEYFSVDFELAAINAIRENFPDKDIAEVGLLHQYNNDPDFALNCRMITALSFVRLNDIKQYAGVLFEYLPGCLDPIVSWFENNYIGIEVRRGQRIAQIAPKFPHELWNVYQRTVDGKNRTNNYAEAGNRRIQSEMGMERPTMGYFIDRLKLIQRGRDQAHARWLKGYQAKPKRTKYRQADDRILKVIEQYNSRSPIAFLRGVALNFMMD